MIPGLQVYCTNLTYGTKVTSWIKNYMRLVSKLRDSQFCEIFECDILNMVLSVPPSSLPVRLTDFFIHTYIYCLEPVLHVICLTTDNFTCQWVIGFWEWNYKYTVSLCCFAFLKAAKTRRNNILASWIPKIRNHFWYCSKECGGDLEKLKVLNI